MRVISTTLVSRLKRTGKYTPGVKPPMDAGFEAVGTVVAIGSGVTAYSVGSCVAGTSYGAFSEYQLHRASRVLPIPTTNPAFLPLLVSGLTASIALERVGEMKLVGSTVLDVASGKSSKARKETILITAAAGATGLFAVQLAKAAGHHVIGTCSSADKVALLSSLGCDRVVNYKVEDLHTVLKSEYKKGVDIVYESVGGAIFDACVRNLAVKGRLIVIGMVSGYSDGTAWKGEPASAASAAKAKSTPPLPAQILGKSASIRGFFLNDYPSDFPRHLAAMTSAIAQGKLQSIVDKKVFVGLEQVPIAIDYMYAGKNTGKVIVDLAPELHGAIKSKL